MNFDSPFFSHWSITTTTRGGVVLSGQVELELDDGVKKTLGPGDCVIQNGTRHRWHNVGAETCRVVFSVVGARRSL